jgi:hypothetical protein
MSIIQGLRLRERVQGLKSAVRVSVSYASGEGIGRRRCGVEMVR